MKITTFIACIFIPCGIIPVSNDIETTSVTIGYICISFGGFSMDTIYVMSSMVAHDDDDGGGAFA